METYWNDSHYLNIATEEYSLFKMNRRVRINLKEEF